MQKPFSKEEIQEAKDVNLVELLRLLGVPLEKHSHEFKHSLHDSLKISEYDGWVWHSKHTTGDRNSKGKGNAIDYLMNGPDFNYDFFKAVGVIRSVMGLDRQYRSKALLANISRETKNNSEESKQKEFILPQRHTDNKRITAYLNRSRGIDYEFINHCIKHDILYESADKHNAIFVGKDFTGKERYACQRGTLTESRFTGDVKNSDKSYNFRMDGTSNIIRVFEAPIDLLSYLTLAKMKGYKSSDTFLSLGGVSLDALDTFFTESGRQIDAIVVCTDNDSAGKDCAKAILEKYCESCKVVDNRPKGLVKDYNELLQKELGLGDRNLIR